MENEIGISVGVKKGSTTNWYRAHSMNRRPDGAMCVFALDDNRTIVQVPAKNFAGVKSGIRAMNGELNPDILEMN